MDGTVESDPCCVWFGYHEDIDTGREWLQCSCNRWIHENCNEDLDESSGRPCPLAEYCSRACSAYECLFMKIET